MIGPVGTQPHGSARRPAVLDVGGARTTVSAGSVASVPAHEPHRFVDIGEDLRVLVLFAPPDDVRTTTGAST